MSSIKTVNITYSECVCVCSLSYLACLARLTYYFLSVTWSGFARIFPFI